MYIVLQIDGGLGKSIAATALCKAIKRKYPDASLIVVTGYPDVFISNPNVYKAIDFNSLHYFYQDYIDGRNDTLVFAHNPYLAPEFIQQQGHLIKIWCEMFHIPYNNEQPELFMNEIEFARYAPLFGSQKPIMLLQTNGGAANNSLYSWVRDMPAATAQAVVNAFANEYNVVHLRTKDQLALQHVTAFTSPGFRQIIALIALSTKRLFIDSFAQHAAAAIGMPSVVCWVGNKPEQFGYPMHANIIAGLPTRKPDLRNSVYSKFNISGDNPTESLYNNQSEIFSPDIIIDVLRNFPAAKMQEQMPAIHPESIFVVNTPQSSADIVEKEPDDVIIQSDSMALN